MLSLIPLCRFLFHFFFFQKSQIAVWFFYFKLEIEFSCTCQTAKSSHRKPFVERRENKNPDLTLDHLECIAYEMIVTKVWDREGVYGCVCARDRTGNTELETHNWEEELESVKKCWKTCVKIKYEWHDLRWKKRRIGSEGKIYIK